MEKNENKKLNSMEKPADLAEEIWFRPEELELLKAKKIKFTARMGNRKNHTCEDKGCYQEGKFFTIKVIEDTQKKKFVAWQTDILVTKVELKDIDQIKDEELKGSVPGQQTVEELKQKFEEFYGPRENWAEKITLINFEYKEDLMKAKDLVEKGVLAIAQDPQDNPSDFETFEHYTVPLIEHDYPAKTPVMWNACYQEFDINAGNIMLVGDPKQSPHILDVFRKDEKFKGGGAGVGFKDEAINHLDELDPLAEAIGSINFILKTPEGKLKGFNTDGLGYAMSLENLFKQRGEELKGKKVVMLGAGGTGNAIGFALVKSGANLVIINRTVSKAIALADRINMHFDLHDESMVQSAGEDKISEFIKDADVILNVSTKGAAGKFAKHNALAPAGESLEENLAMANDNFKLIKKEAIISDIVLTKNDPPLMLDAKNQGFETLGGIPMVVNQGVKAFMLLYEEELKANGITEEKVSQVMTDAAGL